MKFSWWEPLLEPEFFSWKPLLNREFLCIPRTTRVWIPLYQKNPIEREFILIKNYTNREWISIFMNSSLEQSKMKVNFHRWFCSPIKSFTTRHLQIQVILSTENICSPLEMILIELRPSYLYRPRCPGESSRLCTCTLNNLIRTNTSCSRNRTLLQMTCADTGKGRVAMVVSLLKVCLRWTKVKAKARSYSNGHLLMLSVTDAPWRKSTQFWLISK